MASSAWSFVTARTFGVQPAELVAQWRTSLEEAYCARRPAAFILVRLVVVDRWPGTQADYVYDYPDGGILPDSDGAATAPQLSMVLSWRTELAGRSHRGRTYWGFVRQLDVSDGLVVTNIEGGTVPIRTFGFNMNRDFGSGNLLGYPVHSIISRRHDGLVRDPPVFIPVVSAEADVMLRTIRKRNDNPPEYHDA